MSVLAGLARPPELGSDRTPLGRWAGSLLLLGGVALVVTARWLATTLGLDALAVGAAFGLALTTLWLAGARGAGGVRRARASLAPATRQWRDASIAAGAGLGFGLVLVAVAVLGATMAGAALVPGLHRPAAPFAAWAAITIVVAAAEEGILRGALFDGVRAAGGTAVAVVVTTLAFALIHVPLYGWEVVPLDLAVGLGLAGLRLSTRTVLAPVVAHAVADLATWWL